MLRILLSTQHAFQVSARTHAQDSAKGQQLRVQPATEAISVHLLAQHAPVI